MTDNKSILKVLNGYVNLTPAEQNIFIQEISDYNRSDSTTKLSLKRGIETRMDVGPTNTGRCPCCGK